MDKAIIDRSNDPYLQLGHKYPTGFKYCIGVVGEGIHKLRRIMHDSGITCGLETNLPNTPPKYGLLYFNDLTSQAAESNKTLNVILDDIMEQIESFDDEKMITIDELKERIKRLLSKSGYTIPKKFTENEVHKWVEDQPAVDQYERHPAIITFLESHDLLLDN